jgi:hypothetical protein
MIKRANEERVCWSYVGMVRGGKGKVLDMPMHETGVYRSYALVERQERLDAIRNGYVQKRENRS